MSNVENIKIIIDGNEVECRTDETYLDIAERNGIKIPTVCYHPALEPAGKCRVCVVEEEIGEKTRIVASCKELAKHNAIISTTSERVQKTRKALISKMAKLHTEDCVVCGTAEGCQIEILTKKYLVDEEPIEIAEKVVELSEKN